MKKLFCLLFACLLAGLMVFSCKKPQKVQYEKAFATLSDYEGANYSLTKILWGGDNAICRTELKDIKGKDLLSQLNKLPEYTQIMGFYTNRQLFFTQAVKQQDNTWVGDIEIVLGIQDYMFTSDQTENPKPSEVGIPFVFHTFFVPFEYTIDQDGNLSWGDYVARKNNNPWDEAAHTGCHIESLTKDKIIVVFPDYLTPDYSTDQFYTGPVTMEFVRF